MLSSKERREIRKNKKILVEANIVNKFYIKNFVQENFLDENFENFFRFLKKIASTLEEHQKVFIADIKFDVTPEDLRLLGDKSPVECSIIEFSEEEYAVYNSEAFKEVLMTRNCKNRERALKIIRKYNDAKYFSYLSFNDEYIDDFENLLIKMYDEMNFDHADFSNLIFKIHPIFFDVLKDNLMDFFDNDEDDFDAMTDDTWLCLSPLAEKFIDISLRLYKEEGKRFRPIYQV